MIYKKEKKLLFFFPSWPLIRGVCEGGNGGGDDLSCPLCIVCRTSKLCISEGNLRLPVSRGFEAMVLLDILVGLLLVHPLLCHSANFLEGEEGRIFLPARITT